MLLCYGDPGNMFFKVEMAFSQPKHKYVGTCRQMISISFGWIEYRWNHLKGKIKPHETSKTEVD